MRDRGDDPARAFSWGKRDPAGYLDVTMDDVCNNRGMGHGAACLLVGSNVHSPVSHHLILLLERNTF